MPLLERTRVEVYLPDLPASEYQNLLRSFAEELTYTFGGATTVRGLEGSYLSASGERVPDRINLIYSDAPLALSTDFATDEHGLEPVFLRVHPWPGLTAGDGADDVEGLRAGGDCLREWSV